MKKAAQICSLGMFPHSSVSAERKQSGTCEKVLDGGGTESESDKHGNIGTEPHRTEPAGKNELHAAESLRVSVLVCHTNLHCAANC